MEATTSSHVPERQASAPSVKRLPRGVREGLREIAAALAVEPTLAEVLPVAERLDLRDLNEQEVAWLEDVHQKTVRSWRQKGGGPDFRDAGGIRYPIRWYLDWREKGRLNRTARPRS
jgi:hypothetical protein